VDEPVFHNAECMYQKIPKTTEGLCCDDGAMRWRNPTATGSTSVFQSKKTVIGKL
jgi:hypothetical protein